VNKHIFSAIFSNDKSKTFIWVEPFNCSFSHVFSFHDKLAAEELRLLKRCDVEEEISLGAKKAAQSKTAARALGHNTLKAEKDKQKSEKLFLILAYKKEPNGKPALLL
jgi:hypothetical protein